MDHPQREDAPGADTPDCLHAVRGLRVRICGHADVDLFNIRHPADVLHVVADEFAVFVAKVKAGGFDHLVPDELKPPAGPPPEPGRAPHDAAGG